MTQVNSPPRPRLPKNWVNDNEVRAWAEQLQTIVFQLYNRTGGNLDLFDVLQSQINGLKNKSNNLSLIQQLLKESEGLPEFTIDTTGFTTDTTLITSDKVIA